MKIPASILTVSALHNRIISLINPIMFDLLWRDLQEMDESTAERQGPEEDPQRQIYSYGT
jgi:hypothetical protein